MDSFGCTRMGYTCAIKDSMRCDYVEPLRPGPDINKLPPVDPVNPRKIVLTDFPRLIDCYLGNVDGYSYSSLERLDKTRRKGLPKPVGPYDMHRKTVCTSMEVGRYLTDPALEGEKGDWAKHEDRYPIISSEMSRILQKLNSTNPVFDHTNQL